ncbi:tetratricopeptide repeat protein [Eubacteriales bacterium OttesenSCG-928-M02]|nr:tetratricopeptide repeat protein [Eubacteriales bacterium OttesenSCG-928-M02]
MDNPRNNENKILSYQQDGAFYNRLAMKYLEKQDLPAAMEYARRALIEEPDNEGFRVDLAEVFSNMRFYDRSNQVLLPIAASETPLGQESAYYMGFNFMMMGDYDRALNSLSRYLETCPDGEFADEAEDMMMSIYDYLEEVEDLSEAERLADAGKEALDQGDYRKAISLFEDALVEDPELSYARNNLAICQYIMEDVENAVANTAMVLKTDPQNIFALCNMALFYRTRGNEEAYQDVLNRMEEMEPRGTQEILRLGSALGECERDEAALRIFRKGVDGGDFDPRIQLYAGIAAYNCGQYERAKRYFSMLARWETEKSIPTYYRSLAEAAIQNEEDRIDRLYYQYQVPLYEIASRIAAINSVIKQGSAVIREAFTNDQEFQSYVFWGLTLDEKTVRSACIEVLAIVGDNQCVLMLEDMLLSPDWDDEVKNELLMALSRAGREEPFLALINDSIVRAKVSVYDFPKNGEQYYRDVIEALLKGLKTEGMESYADDAIDLFHEYIHNTEGREYETLPMADLCAGLTYLAITFSEKAITKKEVCAMFDTNYRGINAALRLLEKGLAKP